MQTQADDRGGERGWLGERLVDEAEVGLRTFMPSRVAEITPLPSALPNNERIKQLQSSMSGVRRRSASTGHCRLKPQLESAVCTTRPRGGRNKVALNVTTDVGTFTSQMSLLKVTCMIRASKECKYLLEHSKCPFSKSTFRKVIYKQNASKFRRTSSAAFSVHRE